MNIGYLIGLVLALAVMLVGMAFDPSPAMNFTLLGNFVDPSSIFIVIGCTLGIVMASFPLKTVLSIPKHFGILLNTKKFDPTYYIDQLVDLARRIEDFYKKPEDIEWAIVDGQVYLLQSRPITTMK